MTPVILDIATLLEDDAVYRRTVLGQQQLLRAYDESPDVEMRFLARVNGFTPLRQLIELAPADVRAFVGVIPSLVERGLVELVHPAASTK